MEFLVLFSKSAREEDYKQKVVKPTIEEILGVKLNEEINTSTKGNSPGVPGRADGKLKVNDESVFYNWIDHVADCRRLSLSFQNDNKLALQSFLRSLTIKEKELEEEVPQPIPAPEPNSPPQTPPLSSTNNSSSQKPELSSRVIILLVVIGGIVIIFGIIMLIKKTKKPK